MGQKSPYLLLDVLLENKLGTTPIVLLKLLKVAYLGYL